MTSVSARHIILTPTQPVGSRCPELGSNQSSDQKALTLLTEPPERTTANLPVMHYIIDQVNEMEAQLECSIFGCDPVKMLQTVTEQELDSEEHRQITVNAP